MLTIPRNGRISSPVMSTVSTWKLCKNISNGIMATHLHSHCQVGCLRLSTLRFQVLICILFLGLQDTHVDQEFAKLSTLKMELTHVMEGGHEVSKELEKTVMGLTSNVLLQRMKPAQRRDYYKQMKELGRLQAHLLNCIPEASDFGIIDRQPVLHDLEDPIDFHPNPENEWSRSECNYTVQSLDEYLTERAAALHPIDSSPDTSFLESNNLSEKSLLNTAFSLPCEPRSSGSLVSDISTQAVKGDDDQTLSAFSDADASQSKVINKLELVRPSRAACDQVASTSKVHEVHKPSSSSVKKVDPSTVKPTSKIPVFNQCLKTRSLLLKESETLPPKVADAKDSKAALKSYKPSTASSSPMITITEHVDLDVSLQDCQTPEAQKRKTYKRPPSRSETEEMEREFTKRAKRRKVDIFGTPEGKTPPLPSPNEASGSREPVLTGRALMLKQPPQLVNPNSNLSIEQRKVLMQQRLKERQERLESLERMKANQKIAELELELMKVEAEERRRLAAVEKAQARKSTGQLSKDQSSMSVSPRVRRL